MNTIFKETGILLEPGINEHRVSFRKNLVGEKLESGYFKSNRLANKILAE